MIKTITITGADDGVAPAEMVKFSERYPMVEWGILRSLSRTGEPRYPTIGWIARVAKLGIPIAAHYCGRAMRDIAYHQSVKAEPWARRAQLNGWDTSSDCDLADAFEDCDVDPILQCRSIDRFDVFVREAERLQRCGINASVLVDPSGGSGAPSIDIMMGLDRGVIARTITSDVEFGLAGGIDETNACIYARRANALQATWVDFESGAREHNRFSLARAEAVVQEILRGMKGTHDDNHG